MDPLTQASFGASLPPSIVPKSDKKAIVFASVLGFLAGMAPDLDVFIRSSEDPLLFLEFHRQFTHSLIFIPVGGLIVSLVLWSLYHALHWFKSICLSKSKTESGFSLKASYSFGKWYLWCTLGYGTHGLLDACTTYGTQLLWPWSDVRISWNNISIIDPLFTIPLLLCVILALVKRSRVMARLGFAWAICYLILGFIQKERVETKAQRIANDRRWEVNSLSAKPSFANILLWKIVLDCGDQYRVMAIRASTALKVFPHKEINKLNVERDLPWLLPDSQYAKDIERFRWFSQGYLSMHPSQVDLVIDMRYSLIPNEIDGLWGIDLSARKQDRHVVFTNLQRDASDKLETFKEMLFE